MFGEDRGKATGKEYKSQRRDRGWPSREGEIEPMEQNKGHLKEVYNYNSKSIWERSLKKIGVKLLDMNIR
jgi:hypothetical protein